jgi:hypothetical protein
MIWLLLVLYQVKHFLCDYLFQTPWMLGKFKAYPDWILPLLAHAGVHGVGTFLIAYAVKPESALWLALLDMVVHFTVDRIKASPNLGGRWKTLSANEYSERLRFSRYSSTDKNLLEVAQYSKKVLKGNTYFWWALGADQMAHHLCHYFIIWRLMQ